MKSGKRVFGILIVSLLLIVSIGLVSAGLKDWFGFGNKDKDLEGELPVNVPVPAAVVLQDVTSVPIVVFVSDVQGGGTLANHVQPLQRLGVSAGNQNVTFSFVAQVGGDEGNLDIIVGSRGNSTAVFNNSASPFRSNLSCTSRGLVAWPPGSPLYHGANYTCNVVMRYYDMNNAWSINATVRDPTTGKKASNLTKTFIVDDCLAASSSTSYLNWTGLTTADSDRLSDTPYPNVTNDGNVGFTNVKINATYLNGTETGKQWEVITPSNFTVDSVSGCPGSATLQLNIDTSIPGYSVSRATSEPPPLPQTPFYICLKGPLAGLTTQTYKSVTLNPWEIKI